MGKDNPRADAFNLQGVLNAADATNDGSMPEWAKDDFIPLYFHDLVNKKYVPFRSFIKLIIRSIRRRVDKYSLSWSCG